MLLGYPKANFRQVSRSEPHKPDVNDCVLVLLTKRRSSEAW